MPTESLPSTPQLRLLHAHEYRASVQDLLGVPASPDLAYADDGAGYTSRADLQVDENLLNAFVNEAERLAERYVAERLGRDFGCFDPDDVRKPCIAAVVAELGERAYREPLDAEERGRLEGFYDTVLAETGDATLATEMLVARVLTSPRFLYRREVGAGGQLDPFERATLLAFATTGKMPDDALLADAAADRLDEPTMRMHVRRLLATEAGRTTLVRFVRQWLQVRALEGMAVKPASYPKLASAEQGRALLAELDAYVRAAIDEGASLRTLLTGDRTFVNRHTAPLYGASASGDALTPLALDGAQRRGVLSLASAMAALGSVAFADKDRPVVRGLMLKTQLFCEQVGLPSGIDTAAAADMAGLEEDALDALTIREQFEAIMNQGEMCVSCHAQFMPLGFLFGRFDALGRHVTERRGRTIDIGVDHIVLREEPHAYDGHLALIEELAADALAARCLAQNVAAFVTGREDRASLLNTIAEVAVDVDTPLPTLFEEVLLSPAVQRRGAL